ncbi:hypothetical protein JCM3766R1_004026 [Sporobolomyces carnicolor]
MNSSSPFGFASPLGPLHFSHPSRMTSFVLPLPSSSSSSSSPPSRGGPSSRIRSFFVRSSTEDGGTIKSKPSSVMTKKKNESDKLEVEIVECEGSTFTLLKPHETENPSSPPPSYRNAIEEDLYCQDVTVEEEERNRIVAQDQRMSAALKSFGL